jgi:hypothetical protein
MTPEQIHQNWETLNQTVSKHIPSPRKELVLSMLESLSEQAIIAPASSKTSYHNSFPGGYVDHVNRTVKASIDIAKVWKNLGGTLDFTVEELVFSAIFCNIGKIGELGVPNYVQQTNTWRIENLGENYITNPDIDYMSTQDRSLYVLQKNGIELSKNEYLAIRLYEGTFNESNKPYFNQYSDAVALRTNIVYIISTASFIASKVEYDIEKNNK